MLRIACAVSPIRAFAGIALALLVLQPAPAFAGPATVPTGFQDTAMATALDTPVGMTEVPDPSTVTSRRVLFVEQFTARVRLVVAGSVTTVGTVPGVSTLGSERGLLGIAVDPGWPARPYLYVHSTDNRAGNRISISRFTLTGDLSYTTDGQLQFASASRYDLRSDFPDNASNHNGGTVRFGTDGMLYVSLGDDAAGCPALDITRPVGKILRLDVSRLPDAPGGPAPYALLAPADNPYAANADSIAKLVWTSGLRNPFRFTFDPVTSALVIGDVGQNKWEELDVATSGGMDMGWPVREGPDPYTTCTQQPPVPSTGPVAWYDHPTGYSIIGGPIYRRPASGSGRFPVAYEGSLFFLDYFNGFMRRLVGSGQSWSNAPAVPGQPTATEWAVGLENVSDLIELSDGSLAYCRQDNFSALTGELRRITYVGPAGTPTEPIAGLVMNAPRPNPAQRSSRLSWSQPGIARVRLEVYALDGRRLRTLVDDEMLTSGPHSRDWDGRTDDGHAVRSGLFFVRLTVDGSERQARLTLLR